jgi:uncharacterized membrane protein (UPF0182 family)
VAFRTPGHQRPAAGRPIVLPRWPRYVIPIVAAIIALIIIISVIAGVWTDYLWFHSVGYTRVFGVTYGTKWAMFVVAALFMMIVVGVNGWLAYRMRPSLGATGDQQGPEAYRLAVDPHRRLVLGALLALIGLISGLSAAGDWRTWLQFANRTSFGVTDPQFHLDISFFVFVYPFLRMALAFLFAAVLLSLLLATAVHYLYGGLRPQQKGSRATPGARAQLFVLAGMFVLLKAAAYWVDRYGIDFSQRGVVTTGASYTDVHALLPAKTVLAVIAVICALLFLAGAVQRSAMLPAIGFGLLVLSAIIIGGVYPAIIQQFVVKPNELTKETPYLQREITGTRAAYGVSGAQVIRYPATPNPKASPAQLASAGAALPDVRLLDPGVVSQTFQQLQQIKSYYRFNDVLDMDRYKVPGSPVPQDMVVGVRDMSGPPAGQSNWVNQHLVYTHGYGFVSAAAGTTQGNGNPSFTESDIPPSGELPPFQPRVYFGQQETNYVIADTGQKELDFPNESTGGQQNNSYHGGGGVPVGSLLDRLLFAIKLRQLNILLSGAINSHSRIMYVRDPLARVSKVAPFLTLDGDPYPVIANKHIYWVVDAYTTTDNYPYSSRLGLQQATADTYYPGGSVSGPVGQVNYIRNSVKAVVNAYTGAVSLYQWGGRDPILQTWMKAFPGIIKPTSAIPSALMAHLRYPQVLSELQRQILTQFHVLGPQAFFGGQNFWSVPVDPTPGPHSTTAQPPYYLTMTMPGLASPQFSLVTSFTQRDRPNMAAYMAVDSNPGTRDYGKIRLLVLPQAANIAGPQQVNNAFESDPAASIELTQLRKGGSQVTIGNLITLPFEGSLLYTEPVYVSSAASGNSGSYPAVKRVFAYYDGVVGYAPTLQEALAQVFAASTGTAPTSGQGAVSGKPSAAALKYIEQAQHFYAQAQAALKRGNFTAYGSFLGQEQTALANAQKAAKGSPKPAASGSPSPSASPSS